MTTVLTNLNPPVDFANAPLCIGGADKSYIQKINEYVDFTLYFTHESQISRRFGSQISIATRDLFKGMQDHSRYFQTDVEQEIYHTTSNLTAYTVSASEVLGEIVARINEYSIKQLVYQSLPKDMKELIEDLLLSDAKRYLSHSKGVSDKLDLFYHHCLDDLNQLNNRIEENQRLSTKAGDQVTSLKNKVDTLESETEKLYATYEGFIKKDKNALTTAATGAVIGAFFQDPKSILTSLVVGTGFSLYFGRQTNRIRISFYEKMKEIETTASQASQDQIHLADLHRFRSYLIYLKHLLEPAQVSVRNLWVLWTNVVHDLENISEKLDHTITLPRMIQVKTQLLHAKTSWEAVGEKINNIRNEILWQ